MIKKLIIVILVIVCLFSMSACENADDGNYPKDNGIRYDTVIDAIFEEEGSDESKLLYAIEMDNHIVCCYLSGGAAVSNLYKDEEGYYPLSSIKSRYGRGKLLDKTGKALILSITYYADKYVVRIGGLTQNENNIAKEITDTLGSKFMYKGAYFGQAYSYDYMTLLDELPEDYTITIDGVEVALPMTNDAIWAIIISVTMGIALIIIAICIMVKRRKKAKIKLKEDVFN